jgi:plastocyanin
MPVVPRSKPAVAALAISALPLPVHAAVHHRQRHLHARHPPTAAARVERRANRAWRQVMRAATPARVAHPAGDPTDTISDFKFSPSSLTVHVGDTVTWNNVGPTPHTATANDGSFDTGTLSKGGSASHTFSQPGTFAYFCKLHPFMHGTIVVLAATSSSSSNGGGGATGNSGSTPTTSSASPATTTSSNGGGQALPVTGSDAWLAAALGAALVGLGTGLLRRSDPWLGGSRRPGKIPPGKAGRPPEN